jgi:hypothetical protein
MKMAQKKAATKSRNSSNGASGKAANGKRARKTANSKSGRNGLEKLSADELLLRVWQKIYDAHHPAKKVKGR